MDREQLIQRLRARVRRGGPAEQVWGNGELLHVSQALVRAAELKERDPIRARGAGDWVKTGRGCRARSQRGLRPAALLRLLDSPSASAPSQFWYSWRLR